MLGLDAVDGSPPEVLRVPDSEASFPDQVPSEVLGSDFEDEGLVSFFVGVGPGDHGVVVLASRADVEQVLAGHVGQVVRNESVLFSPAGLGDPPLGIGSFSATHVLLQGNQLSLALSLLSGQEFPGLLVLEPKHNSLLVLSVSNDPEQRLFGTGLLSRVPGEGPVFGRIDGLHRVLGSDTVEQVSSQLVELLDLEPDLSEGILPLVSSHDLEGKGLVLSVVRRVADHLLIAFGGRMDVQHFPVGQVGQVEGGVVYVASNTIIDNPPLNVGTLVSLHIFFQNN